MKSMCVWCVCVGDVCRCTKQLYSSSSMVMTSTSSSSSLSVMTSIASTKSSSS